MTITHDHSRFPAHRKFILTKHLLQIEVAYLNISKLFKKNKEPGEASFKLGPHNFV